MRLLVRRRGVVFLGDEVAEQAVGQGLETVRAATGDVDGDRVVVPDVLGERLPALAVEHDDAHRPREADEQIVLPLLVEVQAADDTGAGPREIRLADRLRQRAHTCELGEPAALVLVLPEGEALDDQTLLTPVSSTRRPTSARSAQCLPPSCHHPSTRRTSSRPRRAYSRFTSVISSSPRLDGRRPSMISNTSDG